MPTATQQSGAPAIPDSSPDWNVVVDDVQCPLCEYNLRGLARPRCPECGYQFTWPELFDTTRRLHPYLFEHHPERNLWSFWRTVLGGLRPGTFWRSLHPSQPSRPKRIVIYVIASVLPTIAALLIAGYLSFRSELTAWQSYYQRLVAMGQIPRVPALLEIAGDILRWRVSRDEIVQFTLACLVWPWLTIAGLFVFRWSMRRARVKRVHVVRCVAYSADLLLLLSPVYIVALAFDVASTAGSRRMVLAPTDRIWLFVAVVVLIWFNTRLVSAYRHYLRFDHTVATVLASQLIAALAVWKLLLVIQGY